MSIKCEPIKKFKSIIGTPFGADTANCPQCEEHTFGSISIGKRSLSYCHQCNVAFDIGCLYAKRGRTDSLYYPIIVTRYRYDDDIFEGVPTFLSEEHFQYSLKDSSFEILNMSCTCNKCLEDKE
jgi:hypothetical protein